MWGNLPCMDFFMDYQEELLMIELAIAAFIASYLIPDEIDE
jgi:hypothetical protein